MCNGWGALDTCCLSRPKRAKPKLDPATAAIRRKLKLSLRNRAILSAHTPSVVCSNCNRRFHQLSRLRMHQRMHNCKFMWKCPFSRCRKVMKWKSSVRYHVRYHRLRKDPCPKGTVITFRGESKGFCRNYNDAYWESMAAVVRKMPKTVNYAVRKSAARDITKELIEKPNGTTAKLLALMLLVISKPAAGDGPTLSESVSSIFGSASRKEKVVDTVNGLVMEKEANHDTNGATESDVVNAE